MFGDLQLQIVVISAALYLAMWLCSNRVALNCRNEALFIFHRFEIPLNQEVRYPIVHLVKFRNNR